MNEYLKPHCDLFVALKAIDANERNSIGLIALLKHCSINNNKRNQKLFVKLKGNSWIEKFCMGGKCRNSS